MNEATAELIWWGLLALVIIVAIVSYAFTYVRTNRQNAEAEVEFHRASWQAKTQIEKNKGYAQAFIETRGLDYDLYEFARWLNDEKKLALDYEQLVEQYIQEKADG